MKTINARAALISLFLGLAAVTPSQADQYYVYQTPGVLVISNKEPPPGSKIIKQLNLPETDRAQEPGNPQPNIQAESSPKPSNRK